MHRPRLIQGLLAAAACAALVATGPGTAVAAATGSPAGDHPAPLEASKVATRAHAVAATRTHSTPNALLKELFVSGVEDMPQAPAVSALCQSFLGGPNPYAPLAPDVDVIKGDTVVPTGSQAGCDAAQNETSVAQNPWNPRNLVAASNDYRVFNTREQRNDASGWAYTSFDGGKSWKNVLAPHLTYQTGATAPLSLSDAAGDPALAFGPGNTVYYANLVFSRSAPANGGSQSASGVTVSVSHDGGRTWGQPSIVHLDGFNADGTEGATNIFNDKEWIAVDPHSGAVYVTWTQFTFDSSGNYLESPVVEAKSTDAGRHFSAPVHISPTLAGFTTGISPFGTGTNPVVANDGTLYVAYEDSVCQSAACNAPADHDAVIVAASRDGGRTFTNQEAARDFDFPVNADIGNNALTGENFRINSFPQLAYDRVENRLYATWADDRNGAYDSSGASVRTDGNSFLISADARRSAAPSWSAAVSVGAGSDEVFPAVAAYGGHIAVSYYTRYYDPAGIGVDFAMTSGNRWSIAHDPQRRLTRQTENPQVQFVSLGLLTGNVLQGAFIGDYTAIAMGADLDAHPVWTDFRGNPGVNDPNQDVATRSVPILR
ncbi:exo-alpha-sialidase [Actinocrinis puniceicyclus]|uniref:Exo-alpha-sialidase n=1 Tax=Actinocrinis puniceicyclus TaxID=977794 RepID=A0A8J7WPY8_9ACTN|nr:sialidase family protein [Actinocrinis puniceicyclus]MBS2963405.1 exo-alpha-sialidase [Actinocrinis puniceicyclus]